MQNMTANAAATVTESRAKREPTAKEMERFERQCVEVEAYLQRKAAAKEATEAAKAAEKAAEKIARMAKFKMTAEERKIWADEQRNEYKAGTLLPRRAKMLERLPAWTWATADVSKHGEN